MKRAQMRSQMLIYIVAIFVVVLILAFGYRSINGLMQNADRTDKALVEQQIRDIVDEVMVSYRSMKTEDIRVGKGVREVCFADLTGNPQVDIDQYPLINDSIDTDMQTGQRTANVFLVAKSTMTSFHVDGIQISGESFFCRDVSSNKVTIVFENDGDRVLVS